MPSRRHMNAPAAVFNEHEAILRAADTLEETLAYLAATRRRGWRQRLRRGYVSVSVSLRHHCESTERSDGTLGEIEIVIGRLYQLTTVRREHEQLLAHAAELLAATNRASNAPQLSTDAQARAAQLMAAIRDHCRSEVDLLQLRYILDVGVVD